MPIPQSCIEALLIESGLSLPYAFRSKKPGFLPRTVGPTSPYNFLCEMAPYIEICYAHSGGAGGGVPAQEFRLLVTAGGRTATSFADRLLAHTQQASAHTPKKKKNSNKRCAD